MQPTTPIIQVSPAELAAEVAKALHENHLKEIYCPIDAGRRIADHDWVMMRRKKEEARIKFWEDMHYTLVKYGLIGVLGFLLGMIALGIKSRLLAWMAS